MDLDGLQHGFHYLIGIKGGSIAWWQMTLRGVLIFLYGLIIVRAAGQRVFGREAPLDIILAVLVGSNLSRALTGNAPFVPTLAATTGIFMVYWVFAYWALYSRLVSWVVKGRAVQLVEAGRMNERAMKRHGLGEGDLREAMRNKGLREIGQIEAAFMERDGGISIVPKK